MSTTKIDVNRLKEEMTRVIDRHGEWTTTCVDIADGLSTVEQSNVDRRLVRFLQSIADLARKPIADCRILDLGTAEGQYAIECAMHGAEVVAIEGREANLAKVQFVKEALDLDRLSLYQDDVRNLGREKYGEFDVVICSGILYHLDAPDVFDFARRVGEVCRGIAIVDTQFSLGDRVRFEHDGKEYWGCYYREHNPDASPAERLRDLWASIDNTQSVWLTRPSLYNLLRDVGFTTVLECFVPSMLNVSADRATLVAVKGERARVLSYRAMDSCEPQPWPEHTKARVHGFQDPKARAVALVKSFVPGFVKTPVKKVRAWMRKKKGAAPAGPWEWTEPWRRR